MASTPTAEARLVFRVADPAATAAEVGTLAAEVADWTRAAQLADAEMATASVWRALRGAGVTPPATVGEHLRRATMVSDFRMQRLAQRLAETTAAFGAAGVPVLLLKGAALGALVDPTFRARPMSDLDVLVRPGDVPAAIAALAAAGWHQTADEAVHEMVGEAHHHLPPFLDPRLPGTRIELHVALFSEDHSFRVDEHDLLRDARPAPPPFNGALVPTPEHLMLHACIHFAWQHTLLFGSWRTFRLVGAVAGVPGFSWERFLALARTARAVTSAYWTLRLAQRLCGLSVPAPVLAALTPPTPAFLRAAIERHIIAANVPGEGTASPSLGLSRLLWRAALRPRWSGHRTPARWANDDRWARALQGEDAHEPLWDRVRRHSRSVGRWRDFVRFAFFGR